jgi:hypothetical protein
MLTSLLRRKLLPEDEEWEAQGKALADSLQHVDAEREDELIEWCQTKFMEITEGRDYSRGTKTKEERAKLVEEGNDGEEAEEAMGEVDGEDEATQNGISLGAALKFLSHGVEPTKPSPRTAVHRPSL